MNDRPDRRPLVAAGIVIGIGMGGFVDGILFHQLLQFHNMLSAKLPTRGVPAEQLATNLEINMFWDGLFHAMTWTFTAVGLALLWIAVQRPRAPLRTSDFVGSLLVGWALFNLVEGVLDHHVLHIHHVIETPGHLVWDLTFLGVSVVLLLIGVALIGRRQRSSPERTEARASAAAEVG